ncbi:hypothetical protein FOC1_g10009050 [Fusarium oxysporum f. sp. cubense race 1]|uniref:ZZ-type domain-containing protein n=1 Tax=Fusarium oxysporum f. sp. cubense (strain race 1) TaxID=1229664 RepID=N4TKI9_FUSC1|nr:hypothetical protein FOC1_g10009050 [Fusarium oxysporum f. sp. cubense race 1]
MPSLPAFLSRSVPVSSGNSGGITDAPVIPSTRLGPAADLLENELFRMYWEGVERELPYLLLTFGRWKSRQDTSDFLPEEEDDFIYGYDTFLDSVSDISRQFHERNKRNQRSKRPEKKAKKDTKAPPSYDEVLRDRGWDIFADMKSNSIKGGIRTSLSERKLLDPARRRARMLLQSAQFLDIDKIIEYREPEKALSFWKRPASAQIRLGFYDDLDQPVFVPQLCSECKATIRGCTFQDTSDKTIVICESCYRATHYGQTRFVKKYKECCLPTALTPEMSQAKYASTRSQFGKNDSLLQLRKKDPVGGELPKPVVVTRKQPSRLAHLNETSLPEYGYSYGFSTDEPEDIPMYLRSTIEKYPYGNVHMALRFGPLIIENGVANTMGGVLVTSRDPPSLQVIRDPSEDITKSLLLTGERDRILYVQDRPRHPKRYKAFMKQVVGGAFCDFFESGIEDELIDAFIHESNCLTEDGLTFAEQEAMLKQSTKRLLLHVKEYLASRVQAYISSITARLLDPEVQLKWHYRDNNCQAFCDKLIGRDIFAPLFASKTAVSQPMPLYLMSFVCRPGSNVPTRAFSKYDVPNGLTEEYLLKFRYGRHDDSDIVDTLAEYWTDWGAFGGGPIYPYQDVFPWDCTEAYDRYPGNCGDCNISKHVLAFPFDSWSIASLHLARGRQLYPANAQPPVGKSAEKRVNPGIMTDTEWFKNRITVLLGQDVLLTAAVAMANSSQFQASTTWLTNHEDETMDRLKLGGIHRAQPFSHHFEKGAYHQYFVADWAFLAQPLRVLEYEKFRAWRATKIDVGATTSDDGSGGGGCGTGPFACGAVAAGCAVGSPGMAGDTCGSGCVSSCGGGDGDGGCGGCGG